MGLRGRVARLLQSAAAQAQGTVELRTTEYGDLFTHPVLTGRQGAAISGNYFTFCEATLGTAIATTTSIETPDMTKPILSIYNGGSRSILMDMLKLMVVQVPTGATSWQYWVRTYNGNAYASAGTALTPSPANGSTAFTTSGATIYFGAVVAAVTGLTARTIASGAHRGIIPTTFDTFSLSFGGDAGEGSALLTAGSAKYNENVPPCVLAPGHTLLYGAYGASNSGAPSFKVTGGYYEF